MPGTDARSGEPIPHASIVVGLAGRTHRRVLSVTTDRWSRTVHRNRDPPQPAWCARARELRAGIYTV